MTKLLSAPGVTQPTPSSATTTTTVFLSQGTSARPAEGTGQKEALFGTFLLVVAAERTKRSLPKNPMTTN